MADILIRGMEMPKEPTPLTLYPDGRWNDYTDGANGEFLPLPEGHGRLIDGDALMPDFVKARWAFFSDGDTFLQLLKHATTIVPAEGGNDNG